MSRLSLRLRRGALVLGALALALAPSMASAAESAEVSHIESDGSTISVLVSVPPGSQVNLGGVTASIDGKDATATAKRAGAGTAVQRTTILAIDTSNSMRGARFEAAKSAANTFLDTAPDDVLVGVVAFANEVQPLLTPSTDRNQARSVISQLSLTRQTLLYDGILEAVDQAGGEGARSIIVLSDGADTSDTALADVTAAIKDAEVKVDVVALDGGGDRAALSSLAQAGAGQVIDANSGALQQAFAAEAQALSRQVLVSVTIPDEVTNRQGNVAISLPAGGKTLQASSFTDLRTSAGGGAGGTLGSGFVLPGWLLLPAMALPLLGLAFLLITLLVPKRRDGISADRVSEYTRATQASAPGKRAAQRSDRELALASATDAVQQVLTRNKSVEDRIAARLEAAGSKLKPSEWLLVHLAILAGLTLLGLLLGRGSLLIGFLFLALGIIGPWMYLGFRRSRRLKKFNSSLPDTLQLMAGSLQAGLSLAQSVDTIVREGEEPIASEFKRVLVETRLGVSLEDALEGVTERFDSKDFAWVVMAIKIQRQVGGNLAELLTTVGATMREREYIRRQVAALAAEGKLSAWVLGLLPPLFLLYLVLVNREYVWPMFTEPLGWLMLLGGAVLLSVGVFWMSRLIKVEV